MENSFSRLTRMKFLPLNRDLGLLFVRVAAGSSLFLRHGWGKLTNFTAMSAHFPDPIHFGPVPSLVIALISDGICSVLIIFGLFSRWAALYCAINVGVAWTIANHFVYFGRNGEEGELCLLYIASFLAIVMAGPGRFSLDAILLGAEGDPITGD